MKRLEMMTTMMFLFNPEYDLLLSYYERQCEYFINGFIDYNTFEKLEKEYFKKKKLFTINLN